MSTKLLPISTLAGLAVTSWRGLEMALTEADAASEIPWEDPSIPFLQLVDLDLVLANGQVFKLWSQIQDGTGFHGLYLEALDALPAPLHLTIPRRFSEGAGFQSCLWARSRSLNSARTGQMQR